MVALDGKLLALDVVVKPFDSKVTARSSLLILEYRRSASVRDLDANATGRLFWTKTAPSPTHDASTWMVVGSRALKNIQQNIYQILLK